MAVQCPEEVYPTPPTVIIHGYVIETYPSMSEVPYATVRDRRTKPPPKTTPHPQANNLHPYYNSDLQNCCLVCLTHKSGLPVLVCIDCHRSFHLACVMPRLRDVPRGGCEWRCARCTQIEQHRAHARATEVVALRRVLKEVKERPQLPPKLRLKFLNVPVPRVEISGGEKIRDRKGREERRLGERALPPKRRIGKKKCGNGEGGGGVGEGGGVVGKGRRGLKWVDGESLERRRRYICMLANELGGTARRRKEKEMIERLAQVEESLSGERDVSRTYIQR